MYIFQYLFLGQKATILMRSADALRMLTAGSRRGRGIMITMVLVISKVRIQQLYNLYIIKDTFSHQTQRMNLSGQRESTCFGVIRHLLQGSLYMY